MEVLTAAEELPIGVLHPLRDDGFIAKVMELLEQEQPDHQPHRLGRAAFRAVTVRESFLEGRPRHGLGQSVERLPRIELLPRSVGIRNELWAADGAFDRIVISTSFPPTFFDS